MRKLTNYWEIALKSTETTSHGYLSEEEEEEAKILLKSLQDSLHERKISRSHFWLRAANENN
jgi:hypothetical protein